MISDCIRENGIFYQKGLARSGSFELAYQTLRSSEARLYSDEVVKQLPSFRFSDKKLQKEWSARAASSGRLLGYLRAKKSLGALLDLGGGNGWLSGLLAKTFPATSISCMDINEKELIQGSHVFGELKNLQFYYADIFTCPWPEKTFDIIVLAASIPYFENLEVLILKLQTLLKDFGEIHILDSPMYSTDEADHARKNSEKYFGDSGVSQMTKYYHWHMWSSLQKFNYRVLYHPRSLGQRIIRYVTADSPFPWIIINH